MEDENLVIGEFSILKGMDRNPISEFVKEIVSKYVTVLGVISISRFED
jgi:hypothetical protein